MAGNREGGIAAAATNKKRHGKDFYVRIGTIGGKNGHAKGFFVNRDLASFAGVKGGSLSKRGQRFVGFKEGEPQYLKGA